MGFRREVLGLIPPQEMLAWCKAHTVQVQLRLVPVQSTGSCCRVKHDVPDVCALTTEEFRAVQRHFRAVCKNQFFSLPKALSSLNSSYTVR